MFSQSTISPVVGESLLPLLMATWLAVIAGTCALLSVLTVCALAKKSAPTISQSVQRST